MPEKEFKKGQFYSVQKGIEAFPGENSAAMKTKRLSP
jgi:hypothetical protein